MGDFKFWPVALAGADLIRRRPVRMIGLMLAGMIVSGGFRLCMLLSLHLQIYGKSGPFSLNMTGVIVVVDGMILLIAAAIIGAAVMGSVTGDGSGGRPAAFGGDVMRLLVLSLLLVPAALIVFVAVGFGAGVAVAAHVGANVENAMMTGVMALAMLLVAVLASRLALAGPIALHDGRLRLGESWRLTRSRRWKVFGVFLAGIAPAAAIGALGTSGVSWAERTLHLSLSGTLSASLWKTILDGFEPASLPPLVIAGLLIGLALILQAAPAAALYRALIGDRARDQAATFD